MLLAAFAFVVAVLQRPPLFLPVVVLLPTFAAVAVSVFHVSDEHDECVNEEVVLWLPPDVFGVWMARVVAH